MNFSKVKQFMDQQLGALKNIEELLDHDEKQAPATHTVKPEEIENLKNYVATMKRAAETAKGLAEYYSKVNEAAKKTTKAKEPEKTEEGKEKGASPDPGKETDAKPEPKKEEKPKRNRSSRKKETPADPPASSPDPGPNGEQLEQAAAEAADGSRADAEHETNPAPQVPVAAPEQPATEPQTDINALLAALTIDNLQS